MTVATRSICFISSLTSDPTRKIFIVDDSCYEKKRSKKLELISKIFDHVENRFTRGYRMLTLAFTDGISLIPLDHALLASGEKKSRYCEANEAIDARSHGSKRRKEAVRPAPDILLEMIDRVRHIMTEGSHILFDSWFSFPSLIRELVSRGLHVTARLKDNATKYLFRRNCKDKSITLKELFAKLKKVPQRVLNEQRETEDILGSFHVSLFPTNEHEAVPVKIVFVKNRNDKGKSWIAIMTTDLELSNEAIIRMYSKRWKIEEFFKVVKSFLRLEDEFQGRSYDMVVAHSTIVFLRYIFLEIERRYAVDDRSHGGLFYHYCDEMEEIKLKAAIGLIFSLLEEYLRTNFSGSLPRPIGYKKSAFDDCVRFFIMSLPSHIKRLLPILKCES